eukprot:g7433.t1
MVFSNMLKNSNSHNFEALAKIIGKLDPRDMAPFDGFPEAAILGDRNLIDSLLRGSRRRHDSELNHNWFDNDNKGPLQALYVEDIILLLRKSNLAEVAVELLEKEIKHIDDAVVSKISNIKQCGDLLPAILKLKDEQLRDKCLALPVIKSLVQWKWNSLYKVLILEFVFYIALIALYTLWVSHLPLENATSKDIAPNLVYCMLSLMGPFTMIEFAQKRPRATALIERTLLFKHSYMYPLRNDRDLCCRDGHLLDGDLFLVLVRIHSYTGTWQENHWNSQLVIKDDGTGAYKNSRGTIKFTMDNDGTAGRNFKWTEEVDGLDCGGNFWPVLSEDGQTITADNHVAVLNTLAINGTNTDMNNLITITAANTKRHFYLNNANAKLILRYLKLVGGDVSSYSCCVSPDSFGGSIMILSNGDDNTITKRAWDVYKLAIMGDFGDEIESSVFMQASFIVITMIINIIMLNILISLVCEGFSDALQRKDKEFNIQRTAKVVELEATYLSGKNRTFKFGLAEPVTFHDTAWPNWLLPSLPRSTGREGKETVDEMLIIRVS